MAAVVIDFLIMKCLSTFNGVLGQPLLKALKVVMSIHYQRDSRECYSKSLELAEIEL